MGLAIPRFGTKPVEVPAPAVVATRLVTSRVTCVGTAAAEFTLIRAVGRASCDTCALTETAGAGLVLGKGCDLCVASAESVGADPDERVFAAS